MLGIVLAGGTGKRLWPVTRVMSKQLLPIFDKPMIFYPISLLMSANLRKIIVVTNPSNLNPFSDLLGNGNQWGIELKILPQLKPIGIPDVYNITSHYLEDNNLLILGDNIFFGSKIGLRIHQNSQMNGCHFYGYRVSDPSNYGSFSLNEDGSIKDIEEKSLTNLKAYAIPGLYHFDRTVSDKVSKLTYSQRGELEIVDLIKMYLSESSASYTILDRRTSWLDTGTFEDLNAASDFVRTIEERQGLLIGSPEEVAFRKKWINESQLKKIVISYEGSRYGSILQKILEEKNE